MARESRPETSEVNEKQGAISQNWDGALQNHCFYDAIWKMLLYSQHSALSMT